MEFGYTIIYVPDVSKAASFYERVFGLKIRFADESGTYAEMETGTTVLAFASNELGKANLPQGFRENRATDVPAGIEIVFVTSDVKGAYAHAMKEGAVSISEPETQPWGQEVAYVRDLNGVAIELAAPMG
jgi:lactoylglutathione lyase